jgi:neopullulanase
MPVDTPDWVRDAIFYQVFPDRFASSERVAKPGPLEPWDAPPTFTGFKGGDLLGVVERLPYLEDLGVNALYLTPVFASASNHRYHTYDYMTVDPLLGGNDALRTLLDEAHGRGMRVVLDGVFNHTGRGFWAFHHVLENGGSSPYRNWYHFDQAALDGNRPIRAYPGADARAGLSADEPWIGEASPSSDGTASRERLGYAAWWDLPALPKLNTDEPAVRDHIFGIAEHWLRFGIDGWRLDVPEEIRDGAFWQEFRRRCRAVRPDAYLVGEIWHVAPEWVAGDRFDALMNYPLAEAIMSFVGADSIDLALVRDHHEYNRSVARMDSARFATRLVELHGAYDPSVVEVQLNLLGSHDAPRLRSVLGGDIAAVRLAMMLQATLPGAPCVYYGDEIGLEGGIDPDSRRAFPWDEARWEPGLRPLVRDLLRLRSDSRALRRGSFDIRSADGSTLVFERRDGDERFLVAINAGEPPTRTALDAGAGALTALEPVVATGEVPGAILGRPGGPAILELGGRSGAVLRIT